MATEFLKSPQDSGFRFTGTLSGTSPLLDLGAIFIMVSLTGFVCGLIFTWLIEAEMIGKTAEEKNELDTIKGRLMGINSIMTVMFVIGIGMYLYTKFRE